MIRVRSSTNRRPPQSKNGVMSNMRVHR
jgi:hypothetical protein